MVEFDIPKGEIFLNFTLSPNAVNAPFFLALERGDSQFTGITNRIIAENESTSSILCYCNGTFHYKTDEIINANVPQKYYLHIKIGVTDGVFELYHNEILLYRHTGLVNFGEPALKGYAETDGTYDETYLDFQYSDKNFEPDEEEQYEVLETLKIYPREAHISLDWGGRKHDFHSGAFQVNRTRIRPRKTYELKVSGNKKDLDYLVSFYNRHKGAYKSFLFNYDGVDEVCSFTEKLEVEEYRELQNVVGFNVTILIEALHDNVRPITAEEGEYLPLKPFGNVTVHTDWNTNIVEMGANGRQKTFIAPVRTYSIKLSGHRKHRDSFLEFYRQHGQHISFLFPYSGEDIEVLFPATIEVDDKLECGQVVGFECELELQELRKPNSGSVDYHKDVVEFDCIPLMLSSNHIVEVDYVTGKPRAYWHLTGDYEYDWQQSQYCHCSLMVNNRKKMFVTIGGERLPEMWYDLSTGEAVAPLEHNINAKEYIDRFVRTGSSTNMPAHCYSETENILFPKYNSWSFAKNENGWGLVAGTQESTQEEIDLLLQRYGYTIIDDSITFSDRLKDVAISNDGQLLRMFMDGLYKNNERIAKFISYDEMYQYAIKYLSLIFEKFNTSEDKPPEISPQGATPVKYKVNLIARSGNSRYVNSGRIYDENHYIYYIGKYHASASKPTAYSAVYYDDLKYDPVLKEYVGKGLLAINGLLFTQNGTIRSCLDEVIAHTSEDKSRSNSHFYENLEFTNMIKNNNEIGDGYSREFWDEYDYDYAKIYYNGKPAMNIYQSATCIQALHIPKKHLVLNGLWSLFASYFGGTIFTYPTDKEPSNDWRYDTSQSCQCLNTRLAIMEDISPSMNMLKQVIAQLRTQYPLLERFNVRLEYHPIDKDIEIDDFWAEYGNH